jgi:hypothetical protein
MTVIFGQSPPPRIRSKRISLNDSYFAASLNPGELKVPLKDILLQHGFFDENVRHSLSISWIRIDQYVVDIEYANFHC